jgi:threonine/homoserine/homoserine lactone efflux protein
MPTAYLVTGIGIGFSMAAPVGPMCIRRTLTDRRVAGLVSGLGAATADAIYGSIAGLMILSRGAGAFRHTFSPWGLRWVKRISGVIIAGFGVVALSSAM